MLMSSAQSQHKVTSIAASGLLMNIGCSFQRTAESGHFTRRRPDCRWEICQVYFVLANIVDKKYFKMMLLSLVTTPVKLVTRHAKT